jgi:hypothetical protein
MHRNRSSDSAQLVFHLDTIRASVNGADLLEDALLRALVVEDSCWTVAMDDWRARRPHRWQRPEIKRWRAEGDELRCQRRQIEHLARHCRLTT